MSDLIDRQAAIDALLEEVRLVDGYYCEMDEVIGKNDAIEVLKILPSVQPEITHCKDCRFRKRFLLGHYVCKNVEYEPTDENYCGKAERREECV